MNRSRASRRVDALALVAGVSLSCASCVRNQPDARKDQREDVAVWDFPVELPKATVHLWPVVAGSPARSRRHMETKTEGGRLTAAVTGQDPYFLWQLETPVLAFGVNVVVDAESAGPLQLFYSTPRCAVFSEGCSVTLPLVRGRQTVAFVLDAHDPVRELRLDLPEHVGTRMAFEEITVLRSAELEQTFSPNENVTAASETPTGFFVDASAPDPWLVTSLGGLDTTRVTAVELVIRGPAGFAPQLYWASTPEAFQEPASVLFETADAGELTHRAKLRGRPLWSGKVNALRFDPGSGPGRYIIERLALVHDPDD
ncbi:MAG TPA: hypothetical protein VH062_01635 [Polyangiaceae bacterium]|jgi:hypothetical protein|nr:hypothetical protein [Polyangiaceae bacterium]